jgi:predicted transcriptional regulator
MSADDTNESNREDPGERGTDDTVDAGVDPEPAASGDDGESGSEATTPAEPAAESDSEQVAEDGTDDGDDGDGDGADEEDTAVRDRLEREADRAVEQFDRGVVDLLSWVLDTETRARIYVHLRQHSESTSEEVADGTGLYPSTVREALAELHEEEKVTRVKRESSGAGNNPYEYSAIPPSELVQDVVDDVQTELNAVFNLDQYLGGDDDPAGEPVTVTVREEGAVDVPATGDEVGTDGGRTDPGAADGE